MRESILQILTSKVTPRAVRINQYNYSECYIICFNTLSIVKNILMQQKV